MTSPRPRSRTHPDADAGTRRRRRSRRARASVLTSATVGLATIGGIALASTAGSERRPGGAIRPAIEGDIEPAGLPATTGDGPSADVPAARVATVSASAAAPPRPAPEPATVDSPEVLGTWETTASWYGPGFAGNLTANGETFDPSELTAAHRELPFDSLVRVTSIETGRSVTVRINDRGPYVDGRGIDLSRAAAEAIGLRGRGVGRVTVELLAS